MSEDLKHHDANLSEEIEPANPAADAALGREVRFGLSLLGVLFAMLGAALYVKLGTPGLPWGRANVADSEANTEPLESSAASTQVASADVTGNDRAPLPQPIQVPAHEETPDGAPPWTDSRYSSGRGVAAPPVDAPLPVGAAQHAPRADATGPTPFDIPPAASDTTAQMVDQVAESAEPAATQAWPADEAPPLVAQPAADHRQTESNIERVGGTGNNAFSGVPSDELPAEPPREDGPLVPEADVDFEPHPAREASDIQPAGAKEPTLAVPHNSPYGRPPARDRYAQTPHAPGPRVAPSAEHTPLHTVPGHQWNAPHTGSGQAPHESELERELQDARTPHYGKPHPTAAGPINDLDAPVTEFAAPQDHNPGHQHPPTHMPTADGTYTVAPNDSFWTISQKVYGTGSYFKAVQRHNRKPGTHADGLVIGERMLVPPVEQLEQRYPELCPKRRGHANHGGRMVPASSQGNMHGGRVYVVEEGDTLFDIARYELGKASRWAEIYELNRHQLGSDYDYLAPGTKLVLPDEVANQEPAPITTRPRQPYSR